MIILSLIMILSACQQSNVDGGFGPHPDTIPKADDNNVAAPTSKAVEITNAHFVQIGGIGDLVMELEFENLEKLAISAEKHLLIKRITNADEMNSVSEIIENSENKSLNLDDDNSLEKVFNQYDDNYFEQNNLMIVSMGSPQLEYSYEVSKVEIGEDSVLKVYIDEIIPEMGSDAMADWIGVLEIKKDYFTEDTKLDAVLKSNY